MWLYNTFSIEPINVETELINKINYQIRSVDEMRKAIRHFNSKQPFMCEGPDPDKLKDEDCRRHLLYHETFE